MWYTVASAVIPGMHYYGLFSDLTLLYLNAFATSRLLMHRKFVSKDPAVRQRYSVADLPKLPPRPVGVLDTMTWMDAWREARKAKRTMKQLAKA